MRVWGLSIGEVVGLVPCVYDYMRDLVCPKKMKHDATEELAAAKQRLMVKQPGRESFTLAEVLEEAERGR